MRQLVALLFAAAVAQTAAAGTGPREGNYAPGMFVGMLLFFGCPCATVGILILLLVIGLTRTMGWTDSRPRSGVHPPPEVYVPPPPPMP